ncbi:MAG: pyruvate dehydrogenase complex E1 component subunit beta [Myxococcales bacterium]|nr:pyruvate dehydrogenase complex E1 component subunit beta [Myxococcales bacterium]MCB9731124.1 pyruvate dehydrogenase complex E1 component subunit beta [Deltaproteobacteria bacterium]
MATMTFREALNQALDEEMARDPKVFLMGEEVGQYQGAYKVSQGLLDKYGGDRVVDTPITELSFAGVGVGAAMVGLRPVIEMMTFNFAILALDQIYNNAAKMRLMSGGQYKVPITFRGPNGPAHMLSAQHSQATESWFANVPGLKVVSPATPNDGKGLLKAAIRDDDPVIFLEAELMYNMKGEVSDEADYVLPLGKAHVAREGKDVTVITFSKGYHHAMGAAEALAKDGVEVEVIDLRTIRPLDMETIARSVRKTHRVVTVEEGWPYGGIGAELAYCISHDLFDQLDAPVTRVTGLDVPMPYAENLEHLVLPAPRDVIAAINAVRYRS